MNYYKHGDAANAEQIKAAFEAKGYHTGLWDYGDELFFFFSMNNGHIRAQRLPASNKDYEACLIDIIKTHPDYQELELPIADFEVGDWVVRNDGETFYGGNYAEQITLIEVDEKGKCIWLSSTSLVNDDDIHLWTIADARDGDVLATDCIICIFKKLDKDGYYIISPCIYTVKGGLEVIDDEADSIGSCGFKPATKEDRELLFRKMKEAGYTWDSEKKELKKIQLHYDIANFKPFDKILGRNSCRSVVWRADYFSHIHKNGKLFVGIGYTWEQCIPFNEKTKHLLGTTDPCGEEFINW